MNLIQDHHDLLWTFIQLFFVVLFGNPQASTPITAGMHTDGGAAKHLFFYEEFEKLHS